MTEKTVSFKMPADEVKELDQEADDEGKTRSAYIRSVLRARHIEEQLEDQILTKEDQQEYERRIGDLERRRDSLERKLKARTAEVEAMEETIQTTTEEALRAVRRDYESQIDDLQEENQRLREEENEELRKRNEALRKRNKEITEALEGTFERIASAKHVNDMQSDLTELIEEKAERQWQGTTEQRELIMESRDELLRETKRNRSLLMRAVSWVRGMVR